MDGPPVRLYVRGANEWREEEEWPLPRATYVSLHLRRGQSGSVTSLNDGKLSIEPPGANEGATSYSYPDWKWVSGVVANGPDGRPDPVRRVLTFTSAPLTNDIEVTGPIVLKLYASSDQIDTRFIVKLADQHPQDDAARARGVQPAFTNVSKGWLAASHREKDPQRSTELRPFYTHANPQPLTPGEIYEFDIEVLPISYVFKQGHRIRLEIANGDSPVTDAVFTHPYHPTLIGTDTIHHNAVHASRLLLPVVQRAELLQQIDPLLRSFPRKEGIRDYMSDSLDSPSPAGTRAIQVRTVKLLCLTLWLCAGFATMRRAVARSGGWRQTPPVYPPPARSRARCPSS
jgi:putative CocE/NonD family hydrolase